MGHVRKVPVNKIFLSLPILKEELGGEQERGGEPQLEKRVRGSLGGAVVWRLPLAQGTILETRDRIPRWAPGAWSLLLLLPVSLPLSLSV